MGQEGGGGGGGNQQYGQNMYGNGANQQYGQNPYGTAQGRGCSKFLRYITTAVME